MAIKFKIIRIKVDPNKIFNNLKVRTILTEINHYFSDNQINIKNICISNILVQFFLYRKFFIFEKLKLLLYFPMLGEYPPGFASS